MMIQVPVTVAVSIDPDEYLKDIDALGLPVRLFVFEAIRERVSIILKRELADVPGIESVMRLT